MGWLLCLGCLRLLHRRRGHRCRAPYPKAAPDDPGVARVGVANMLCVGKLWPGKRPWALWRKTT